LGRPGASARRGYNIGHFYRRPNLGNIFIKFPSRLKNDIMYLCDTCNLKTNNKTVFNTHLLSSKHQRLCSENVKCKNYIHSLISVDSCGSGAKSIPQKPTSKKSDVSNPKKTPINNIVHIDLHNEDAENNVIYHSSESGHVTIPIDSHVIAAYACKYCKRPYINRTGLWRHNKKYGSSCIVKVIESSKVENTEELKNMINTMMDMNKEFKTQILDLYKANAAATAATTAMVASPTTVINNNTNNNNMTNCYNQTFNLQFFLNEQCKDAMNMKDFVNSIQLNTDDLESVGKLGYVEGMSNILITNLNKTELHKRPVHCSDIKRETLYVKDEDKWEQDGPDHAKMTNAVLAVEHKNVRLMC
jgi:ferritin